ncbi:MAG: lamin tail domain-containing protein, partial [Deltaproteobacteria bacterium]|nr:lamin tail domain-containing protein [Deltaproteobacteria bacterium]
LTRILVRASVPLRGATGNGSFWLEGEGGEHMGLRSLPADEVCSGQKGMPRCLWLRLAGRLAPLRVWRLRATREVKSADGRTLFSDARLRFASASGPDERAPTVFRWRLRVSDRCLLVDAQGSERTDLRVRISGGDDSHAGIAKVVHHLGVPISLPLVATVHLSLADLAGNVAPPVRKEVHGEVTPRVVITEILANPRGPEPTQEWVEIQNLSESVVDIGGWTLDDNDDGVGRNVLPSALLGPGQRAVIVGTRFDSMAPGDPPIAEGAVLLRVDGTVGSLGLANGGESLALRDASGRLVSSYGGFLSVGRKQDEGRSVVRGDPFACDLPEAWGFSLGDPTPGAPDKREK